MLGKKKNLKVVVWCLIFTLVVSMGISTRAENSGVISKTSVNQIDSADNISISLNRKCSLGDELEFEAIALRDGDYELEIQYTAINKRNPIVSLKIDGEYPIKEAERIEFQNNWIDGAVVRVDEKGNEIAPEQILFKDEITCVAINRIGMYENPYTFALKKGANKISLKVYQGEFKLSKVCFKKPEKTVNYNEWLSGQNVTDLESEPITIEAEKATLKSDKALIPLSDSTSPNISPESPVIKKLNYIGGSNWSSVGDTLTWSFECNKAGYYYLGFVYKQDAVINGVSYRHLKIDGKTPFTEARRMKFKYDASWNYYEYAENNKPYLFYLDAGEHTISLSVTAGEISQVYSRMSNVVAELGNLYIDITMIVGETVDNNRSYELFNQIPQFNEKLEKNISALDDLVKTIESLQGKTNGSMVSNIISAI